jgi:hypothetical protein
MADIDGIESFLNRYANCLSETAIAFDHIGAVEIAAELRAFVLNGMATEHQLDRLNQLINDRAGYSESFIQQMVQNACLASSIKETG